MGRINANAIPPAMLYRGWNMLAYSAGESAHKLRQMQEEFRAAKNYEMADRLRDIAQKLEDANEYLGIVYTPDDVKEKESF